jgi:peptidoglycan/xylan/chitin deacetylase (PgdA/CDA1 family)
MHTRRRFAQNLLFATMIVIAPRAASTARGTMRGTAGREPWPAGHRGAISLTYDDGLDSQLDIAVPQLNARGLRGTFFVTQSNIRSRLTDWISVGARGHEIANHTVSHPCDLSHLEPVAFVDHEVAAMERWLDTQFGRNRPHVFAYPCDVTDLGTGTANRQAKRYAALLRQSGIIAARTSEGPPNSIHFARHHPYRLQARALGYDSDGTTSLWEYLALAAQKNRWAILVIHEIAQHPHSKDVIGAELHAHLLQTIATSPLWCAPLGEVFDRIRSAEPAR